MAEKMIKAPLLNDGEPIKMSGELFLVAVTGSVGCGKSRVSRWLAERGAHLLDADQDARAVLEPGSSGWQAVVARFGATVLAGENSGAHPPLDRRRLGEIVFRDPEARAALEAIVHPRIQQRQALALAQWQQATPAGETALVVAEIPLLFETNGEERYDWTVAVLCGPAQWARLQERTGMSPEVRRAVIAQQLPEADKRRRARQTIDNSGPWSATERLLEQMWAELQQRARQTGSGAERRQRAWPHRWPEAINDWPGKREISAAAHPTMTNWDKI
ncbi:MAG: dephospho-CoA kinase [Magnetococcales bacterium]|nr:dephospho-CoA kinase [Magnetococcales bacterium]